MTFLTALPWCFEKGFCIWKHLPLILQPRSTPWKEENPESIRQRNNWKIKVNVSHLLLSQFCGFESPSGGNRQSRVELEIVSRVKSEKEVKEGDGSNS